MQAAAAIFIALTFTGSLSPEQAKQRAAEASRKEAVKICQRIEKDLGNYYAGGSYSTEFDCQHPFTAHFVGQHFKDHWSIRWNDWYPNWPAAPLDTFEPKPVPIREQVGWCETKIVSGFRWKINLSPQGGR